MPYPLLLTLCLGDAPPRPAGVVSEDSGTPLHRAAWAGDLAAASSRLAAGAKVDARNSLGWTALHAAAMASSPKLVELLLRHKADVNARDSGGWTPLHAAARMGRKAA